MSKYGVTHRLATAYHPQTSGQVEVSNQGLKRILERTVGENCASWSDKLDEALWAFRTAFKTPIGCMPYKLVYKKSCHLPIELEHKAYWALKHANFDLKTAGDHRKLQLNELRDQAYENSLIYKERTKKLHDSKIKNRVFNVGDRGLLFNSRLKIFSGKFKTRWSGPFTITKVFPYGTIELSQPAGPNFKVNGHRVKHYFGGDLPPKLEGFDNLVKDTWMNLNIDEPNGMIKLKKKLQALKIIIKQWFKHAKKSSYKARISIHSKLSDIDKILYQGGRNEEILNKRSMLLKELHDINSIESMELAIRGVLVNGDWIVEPNAVKSMDNANITRKRSKPDKHGHENGYSLQESGECFQGPTWQKKTSRNALIGGNPKGLTRRHGKKHTGKWIFTLKLVQKKYNEPDTRNATLAIRVLTQLIQWIRVMIK
ncbi:reverse transcriptase domain-containing protein [Tanacetum coccineum]